MGESERARDRGIIILKLPHIGIMANNFKRNEWQRDEPFPHISQLHILHVTYTKTAMILMVLKGEMTKNDQTEFFLLKTSLWGMTAQVSRTSL